MEMNQTSKVTGNIMTISTIPISQIPADLRISILQIYLFSSLSVVLCDLTAIVIPDLLRVKKELTHRRAREPQRDPKSVKRN
jgi:hypothetical protein